MSVPPSVAEATAGVLARAGVDVAFTVPGESFLDLLDALGRTPSIRLVSTRHEGGAAFMAEAYGKATGSPALAVASRGPGAGNLSIGLHTALQDQTPLVALIGQVESGVLGREGFQEVDLAAFLGPVCKWSVQATTPASVPQLVAEAVERSVSGRPGPVAVAVPVDLWAHPFAGAAPEPFVLGPRPPATGDVDLVAGLLTGARSPVMIVGAAGRIDPDATRQLAERLGIGVYVAFRRQDSFPEDHPSFLGHLRSNADPRLLRALVAADVVLVLGTRLDAVTSQAFDYPTADQHLVVVGRGLSAPAGTATATVVDCDAAALVRALVSRDLQRPPSPSVADGHRAAVAVGTVPPPATEGLHPATVVAALRAQVDDDAVLTCDAGNFANFFSRYWGFTARHGFLGPCGGAMGYGVPAAVAAKLAFPDRQVVTVVGDGGFLMTGAELETAVRLGLALTVVVFQNGLYGTIAMHQARTHGRMYGTEIGDADLALVARGLGAEAFVVDKPGDLDDAFRAALGAGRAAVVVVRTDPDVIAPERSLADLLAGHHSHQEER